MHRKWIHMLALALVVAIGLSAAAPCLAVEIIPEDPPDEPPADPPEDPPADPPEDPEDPEIGADKSEVFARIVAAFPELELTVEQLQAHFDEGWGLGELVICSVVATDSTVPFEEVLAMAAGGMGWGEIAKAVDMEARNLGQAVSAVMGKKGLLWKDNDEEVEEALEGKAPRGNAYGHDPQHRGGKPDKEKPDKEKPDKPDKPKKDKPDNPGKGEGKGKKNK
ncbi:MAG: hypothetical protein WCZ48_08270 [Bacillota bacterium]